MASWCWLVAALRRTRQRRRYAAWFRASRAASLRESSNLAVADGPRLSVVIPTRDPNPAWIRAALESLFCQRYKNWEAVVVDDASAGGLETLEAFRVDTRLRRLRNERRLGIAGASNRGAEAATGDWLTFLDHDDLLEPDALSELAQAARTNGASVIYSDEDKIDRRGVLCDPSFKAAFSPDLLYSTNYVGHCLALERELFAQLGGMRPAYDGAQDYDLVLRAARAGAPFAHIPLTLYHWRMSAGSAADPRADAKSWAFEAGRRALEAHLAGSEQECTVRAGIAPGFFRVQWGGATAPRYRVVGYDPARSPSHGWPEGVSEAETDVVIFRSRAVDTASPQACELLARHAVRKDVAVAGGMLHAPRGSILHAGVVFGGAERVRCSAERWRTGDPGPMGILECTRDVSGVTGGLVAVSLRDLRELGGLDTSLGFDTALLDFGLRAREAQRRVVFEPLARCVAAARVTLAGDSVDALCARWGSAIETDRFHSPHFCTEGSLFQFPY